MSEKDILSNETPQEEAVETTVTNEEAKTAEVEQTAVPAGESTENTGYTYTPYEPTPAPAPKKKKLGKKKIIAIAAAVVLLLIIILSGGGKSDAAKAVDDQIKAIGKVSLESGALIEEAEKAVNNLSADDKDDLDKLDKLEKAREKYNKLVFEDNVKKIEEAIDAIGKVSVEAADKINAARTAYDDASDEAKAEVGNLDKLEAAEKEYNDLLVGETVSMINQIGTVTLDSKEKIDAARDAYNTLTEENKKAVTNVKVLEDAEAAFKKLAEADKKKREEERKKKIKEALSGWSTKKDQVYGTVWYMAPSQPKYVDTRCYVLPYIAKVNDGSYVCRLEMNYTGDDWVFWETAIFSVDGEIYTKYFKYSDMLRDNDSGDVWEQADFVISDSDIDLLKAIASSKKTIVRFDGDDDQYDYVIPAKDKESIKSFLKVYELINSEVK